jgi:hypothetical protein
MHRLLSAALSLAFILSLAAGVDAKQCRDKMTGKFIKCPTTSKMTTAPKKCRDASGKFVKCKTK